ncbi:MAG: ribosomal protein L22, partial [Lentisphaeria bacterium]
MILADGRGSNSSSRHLFKEALQQLANEIRMAHCPPSTSKWNPIEHKLFKHVTRAMSGVVFKNHELVRELIENTHTEQGLNVTANIIDKVYETGK